MEWLLVLIICVIIFNKFVKKDKGVSDKAVTKVIPFKEVQRLRIRSFHIRLAIVFI